MLLLVLDFMDLVESPSYFTPGVMMNYSCCGQIEWMRLVTAAQTDHLKCDKLVGDSDRRRFVRSIYLPVH